MSYTIEVKVGQTFGTPGEPPDYAVAAVTADSVVLVRRINAEEPIESMVWRADEVRQQQILYPDTWLDALRS